MERTERLLDLVALLLDAKEPISWAQLREAFPSDYGQGSDEACERKFERDKAELLELGIPIRYVQGDDDQADGYIVDRDAYYLPDVGLTPEELAVLYAAGSAALASGAFPGRHDLAHAMRKIGFSAGSNVAAPKVRMELGAAGTEDVSQKLEALWDAAAARKWVAISYYSPGRKSQTERKVDPYGLALRRGVWSLVGYCHLRQGIRTFHVQRIRSLNVNTAKPRSADFEVPKDFQLDRYTANQPWEYRFHEPTPVELRLTGELARIAPGLFPGAASERDEDGSARVRLTVTYLDGLLRYALSLAPDCAVLSPEDAVTRLQAMAARVVERHRTNAASTDAGDAPRARTAS